MESQASNPTFQELVSLEPRIAQIRQLAKAAGRERRRWDGGFCANAVWYGYSRHGGPYGEGALRSKVIDLVSHNSRHANPIMHTSGTYDLVYQTLWALLPPCDHDEKACGWGE